MFSLFPASPPFDDRRFPLLAPLALTYAAASSLHRRIFLRPALRDRRHLLPLILVGSLRAGGAGKTSVAMELARRLAPERRVGLIAYWLGKAETPRVGLKSLGTDLAEVGPDADWKCCSDEAVLLRRESGARVFVSRNRERAWDSLSRLGEFDVLVSDDGLMDSRLRGAFRVALRRPDENPGIFDLLPAGPYHLTARALRGFDCVADGPGTGSAAADGCRFGRTLVFPDGFDKSRIWWAISGMGNPGAFCRDLEAAGVRLAGCVAGPNHGLPPARGLRRAARLRPGAGFLCAAKDAEKLRELEPDCGPVAVIRERIDVGAGLPAAISGYLAGFPTS